MASGLDLNGLSRVHEVVDVVVVVHVVVHVIVGGSRGRGQHGFLGNVLVVKVHIHCLSVDVHGLSIHCHNLSVIHGLHGCSLWRSTCAVMDMAGILASFSWKFDSLLDRDSPVL